MPRLPLRTAVEQRLEKGKSFPQNRERTGKNHPGKRAKLTPQNRGRTGVKLPLRTVEEQWEIYPRERAKLTPANRVRTGVGRGEKRRGRIENLKPSTNELRRAEWGAGVDEVEGQAAGAVIRKRRFPSKPRVFFENSDLVVVSLFVKSEPFVVRVSNFALIFERARMMALHCFNLSIKTHSASRCDLIVGVEGLPPFPLHEDIMAGTPHEAGKLDQANRFGGFVYQDSERCGMKVRLINHSSVTR